MSSKALPSGQGACWDFGELSSLVKQVPEHCAVSPVALRVSQFVWDLRVHACMHA